MNNNFCKKNNGYLLIDVLAVFGIIALLSTISIPYIRQYQPNLKLNSIARNLISDLRYAQQLTITEQIAYSVNFNLENDSYTILKFDIATTTIKTVEFDTDVSYQQIIGLTDNKAVFNFYGGVSEPGQVILININGKIATINIKPSGYIQLEN